MNRYKSDNKRTLWLVGNGTLVINIPAEIRAKRNLQIGTEFEIEDVGTGIFMKYPKDLKEQKIRTLEEAMNEGQ